MTQYQQLTPEDQYIMDLFHCPSGGSFNREAYELHIADRNDYAVMLARTTTNALRHQIFTRTQVSLSFDDANTLRRAEIALWRWSEAECGNGSDWYIRRDTVSGIPYRERTDGTMMYRIPDREAGALRRIADVCKRNGLHYFHQTDPRGCSLYVSNEPLSDTNYNRGIACCA